MGLTRKGEYAIRGIIHLARQQPGEKVLIHDLAAAVQAPPSFLAKIFQVFAKTGLVRSVRGSGGGFTLGRPADRITLREVVEAVEGRILPNRCLLDDGVCGRSGGCKVHRVWHRVQAQIQETLDGVTIAELAMDEEEGP